jgi:uncharacterized damage-inducible protein DinB
VSFPVDGDRCPEVDRRRDNKTKKKRDAMPTSNPVEILLEHDRWATRNIIEACGALTQDQFHQRYEMGPGSLHDTTTHILSALRGWGDLLAGREQRPRIDGTKRAPAELLALLDESAADFSASARKHPLEETVSRERDGKHYTFTRGGVITHVMTHGMHHRAQCLNMLRHLGVNPLPHSSVLEWMLMADPKR